MGKVIDLTGQTFGELTVISCSGSNRHGATWLCVCSCGKECVKLGYKLVSGKAKSCGHSRAKTPEEMRKYKLDWYHANKPPLSGEHKNQNTDKTHCIRGHEFTAENTYVNKEGHRRCIICRNAEARETARAAEAKYRALKRSDPIRWQEERRRRRAEQLKRIGWTLNTFEEALSIQGNKCAICKIELDFNLFQNDKKNNGATTQAHADHEHTDPPKPRGVLCGNCNLGIGNLKENPEIMRAAIAYIEKFKIGGKPSGPQSLRI